MTGRKRQPGLPRGDASDSSRHMESETGITLFGSLIWGGTALSLLGFAGLVWCITIVWRARRAQLEDAQMRDLMSRVLPLNLGALFVSVIGLMLVIIGIFLS